MLSSLSKLLLWIKKHKIQHIAHKLWREDGKKKEPTYWLGSKSNYYLLKATQKLNSEKYKPFNPLHLAYLTEKRLESLLAFLKTLAILEILGILGNITIVIALITFLANEKQRRDAEIYQAWQVITAAYQQPGSGGRKEALEFLNSSLRRFPFFWLKWKKQSLAGLAAPKAFLHNIQLPQANLGSANLQEAFLGSANLREAILRSANLQEAILVNANLQEADLRNANLQEAVLGSANLQEAILGSANLREAILVNANLQEAILVNANLQEAIYTDKNTPQIVCEKVFLKYPCATIFPDNFDPKSYNMTLITDLKQLEKILEKYSE